MTVNQEGLGGRQDSSRERSAAARNDVPPGADGTRASADPASRVRKTRSMF